MQRLRYDHLFLLSVDGHALYSLERGLRKSGLCGLLRGIGSSGLIVVVFAE